MAKGEYVEKRAQKNAKTRVKIGKKVTYVPMLFFCNIEGQEVEIIVWKYVVSDSIGNMGNLFISLANWAIVAGTAAVQSPAKLG